MVGVIVDQRLNGDRFFTSLYRDEVYTPEGIEWIRKNSMRTVLKRHFPELAHRIPDGRRRYLAPWKRTEPNVFAPWGTSEKATSS